MPPPTEPTTAVNPMPPLDDDSDDAPPPAANPAPAAALDDDSDDPTAAVHVGPIGTTPQRAAHPGPIAIHTEPSEPRAVHSEEPTSPERPPQRVALPPGPSALALGLSGTIELPFSAEAATAETAAAAVAMALGCPASIVTIVLGGTVAAPAQVIEDCGGAVQYDLSPKATAPLTVPLRRLSSSGVREFHSTLELRPSDTYASLLASTEDARGDGDGVLVCGRSVASEAVVLGAAGTAGLRLWNFGYLPEASLSVDLVERMSAPEQAVAVRAPVVAAEDALPPRPTAALRRRKKRMPVLPPPPPLPDSDGEDGEDDDDEPLPLPPDPIRRRAICTANAIFAIMLVLHVVGAVLVAMHLGLPGAEAAGPSVEELLRAEMRSIGLSVPKEARLPQGWTADDGDAESAPKAHPADTLHDMLREIPPALPRTPTTPPKRVLIHCMQVRELLLLLLLVVLL